MGFSAATPRLSPQTSYPLLFRINLLLTRSLIFKYFCFRWGLAQPRHACQTSYPLLFRLNLLLTRSLIFKSFCFRWGLVLPRRDCQTRLAFLCSSESTPKKTFSTKLWYLCCADLTGSELLLLNKTKISSMTYVKYISIF